MYINPYALFCNSKIIHFLFLSYVSGIVALDMAYQGDKILFIVAFKKKNLNASLLYKKRFTQYFRFSLIVIENSQYGTASHSNFSQIRKL